MRMTCHEKTGASALELVLFLAVISMVFALGTRQLSLVLEEFSRGVENQLEEVFMLRMQHSIQRAVDHRLPVNAGQSAWVEFESTYNGVGQNLDNLRILCAFADGIPVWWKLMRDEDAWWIELDSRDEATVISRQQIPGYRGSIILEVDSTRAEGQVTGFRLRFRDLPGHGRVHGISIETLW